MSLATLFAPPSRSSVPSLTPGNARYWTGRGREVLREGLRRARLQNVFTRGELTQEQSARVIAKIIRTGRDEMAALTRQLNAGKITLDAWHKGMARKVIANHHAAVMASTSRSVIDPADRRAFEALLAKELAYLEGFRRDIGAGAVPRDGRLVNRARLYAAASHAVAQNVEREGKIREGFTQARLILGGTERHCRMCPADAIRGWVAIESLAPIGTRTCRSFCRCRVAYRKRARTRLLASDVEAGGGEAGAPLPAPPSKPTMTPALRLADLERRIADLRREMASIAGDDPAARRARFALADRASELGIYADRVRRYEELARHVPGLIPAGPIQERIAEYAEGDAIVKKLAALDRRSADDRRLHRAISAELDEVISRTMDPAYVSNPADRAAYGELIAAKETLSKRIWEETQRARVEAMKILGVDNPLPIAGTGKVAGESDKAFDYVGKVVAGGGNDPLSVEVKALRAGQRPEASFDGRSIKLNKDGEAAVGVHELGHILDKRLTLGDEKALARSLEFLRYRVGDESLRPMAEVSPMAGYEADELGRKDKFDAAFPGTSAYYVGKSYRGTGTEILSMGLEKLYRDPAGFARQDPEYARFIIGIIRGPLR